MSGPYPRLTRVVLDNYRSIAHCDVELGGFTVLVGPNGAGKSNFLDAIVFVADALKDGLPQAIRKRGGIQSCKFSGSNTENISIHLHYELRAPVDAHDESPLIPKAASYCFTLNDSGQGGYSVVEESLVIDGCGKNYRMGFRLTSGGPRWLGEDDLAESNARFNSELRYTKCPPARSNDLYLSAVSRMATFANHHEILRGMLRYHPAVNEVREPYLAEPHARLAPDASNLATAFKTIQKNQPDRAVRIREYLAVIVSGLQEVSTEAIGGYDLLSFTLAGSNPIPDKFSALAMSDGTLRALALLTASLQPIETNGLPPCWLVAIEEPETAIHPGAAGVLMDAFHEAAEDRQVLITTHSPDLLDRLEPSDQLLVAEWEQGATRIGPPDYMGSEVLRQHLATAGELQRQNHFRPAANGFAARSVSVDPVAAEAPR